VGIRSSETSKRKESIRMKIHYDYVVTRRTGNEDHIIHEKPVAQALIV
jgi:hypothetical protein